MLATSHGKKRRNNRVTANMNRIGMITSSGSEKRSPPSPTVTSWSRCDSVKYPYPAPTTTITSTKYR